MEKELAEKFIRLYFDQEIDMDDPNRETYLRGYKDYDDLPEEIKIKIWESREFRWWCDDDKVVNNSINKLKAENGIIGGVFNRYGK